MPESKNHSKNRIIPITTSITMQQFELILQVQKKKTNFRNNQDVIRAALDFYFETFGYSLESKR